MTNEIFFLIQILLIIGFTIWAVRVGRTMLVALIALEGVLANLFVVKQMDLFSLTVTCSDVFAVGCIVGLNLMQEYFGKEEARKTIHVSFFAMIFFVLVSQVHLWYHPALQDAAHPAFVEILAHSPRIVLASIAVFYIVQTFDVAFFGALKKRFNDRHLILRMGLSLTVSQMLDTVLFSFAGLYGIVASLFDVITVSFVIKCLVIACSAPLASLARRFIKAPKRESQTVSSEEQTPV